MSEPALENYVNAIDFSADRALGICDAELNLIGFTHVAIDQKNALPNWE
jgi:hypothetical protein